MPILGVSITKRRIWEGDPEEFSNIYHYSTEDGAPDLDIPSGISDSDAVSLVEQIADLERPIHDNETQFVRGRVWGPVDAPASENVTVANVDLSGVGLSAGDAYSCLEDTILIRMRTARLSVRDRPVWLRKWYRTMGPPQAGGSDFSAGVHQRSEQLDQEDRDAIRAAMTDLIVINLVELSSFPDRLIMVSPSDRRLPNYDDPQMEVYPYLQTHDVKY